MRVLHVIDTLGGGGGAEHALRLQLPLLAQQGIESTVVCLRERAGPLADLVREEGTHVEVLPSTGRVSAARLLRAEIRKLAPDLVHATLFDSCLASRMATPMNVKLLNSIVSTSYASVRTEELGARRIKRRAVQAVDLVSARRVDHFHALTYAVAKHARSTLSIAPGRITVIPRGRSRQDLGWHSRERRRKVRDRLSLRPESFVVIAVGRQEPAKDQPTLVRAFSRVVAEVPDATLLIVGRHGHGSAALSSAIESTGVGDSVRLLGHRTDVADLLAASDLFAFPSVYEGLGSALIEAMALSLPIVASDIPAVREVLDEGNAGHLVLPRDPEALAQAILTLFRAPERRAEYARRALDYYERHFTLDAVVDATARLYSEVATR